MQARMNTEELPEELPAIKLEKKSMFEAITTIRGIMYFDFREEAEGLEAEERRQEYISLDSYQRRKE